MLQYYYVRVAENISLVWRIIMLSNFLIVLKLSRQLKRWKSDMAEHTQWCQFCQSANVVFLVCFSLEKTFVPISSVHAVLLPTVWKESATFKVVTNCQKCFKFHYVHDTTVGRQLAACNDDLKRMCLLCSLVWTTSTYGCSFEVRPVILYFIGSETYELYVLVDYELNVFFRVTLSVSYLFIILQWLFSATPHEKLTIVYIKTRSHQTML